MLTGLFEFVAVLSATVFAGAALYITRVEHPARMAVDLPSCLAQWRTSYPLAVRMQVPLAVVASMAGVGAWLSGGVWIWLLGAVPILSVIPFTLLVIAPVNTKLYEPTRYGGDAVTRELLMRWGRLHAIRSGLSLLASAIYILATILR